MRSMQVPSLNEGSCEIQFIKIYSQKTAAAWITDEIRAKFHFNLEDPLRHRHVPSAKLDCHCSWGRDLGGIIFKKLIIKSAKGDIYVKSFCYVKNCFLKCLGLFESV